MKYLILSFALSFFFLHAGAQKAENFNLMQDNPVGRYYTGKDSLYLIVNYDSVYFNGKMQVIQSCEKIKTYDEKKYFQMTVKSKKDPGLYMALLQKSGSVYSFSASNFTVEYEKTLIKK